MDIPTNSPQGETVTASEMGRVEMIKEGPVAGTREGEKVVY